MSFLQMSISGAAMILAVIVIRALAINRLPKKTFIAFWGIVLLRLLVPFSFSSPFSAYSLVNNHIPVTQGAAGLENANILPAVPVGLPTTGSIIQEQTTTNISPYLIIWGIGTIACALFFAVAYFKYRREFRESLPVKNDFATRWIAKHKLTRTIEIRQSSRISAPLTYGVFKPIILMPKNTGWDDTKQIEYILAHEFVHIKRFDAAIKLLLTAALCIHWFNPLVWAMYILSNRDIELSSDETVVRSFGNTTKSAYARTLISMEEKKNTLTPLCNNFSKNAIEERITAIMKIKKQSIAGVIVAIMLVAGTATVFASSAVTAKTPHQQANVTTQNDGIVQKSSAPIESKTNDIFGVYSKDTANKISDDTSNILNLNKVQDGDFYGTPVVKGLEKDNIATGNIIYFDSEAERDNHFQELEANTDKGINRYTGFEAMYAEFDIKEPITYIVR